MPRFPLLALSHLREQIGLVWASSSKKRRSMMPFQLSLVDVSAVVLLLLCSLLLNHGESSAVQGPSVCTSYDHANPLAESFPNNATGVLNATLAIIPISLETVRRIIPPQYGILEGAYRALVPNFPKGMYPVLVQAAHDHDVQFRAYGITIDDFSVSGPAQHAAVVCPNMFSSVWDSSSRSWTSWVTAIPRSVGLRHSSSVRPTALLWRDPGHMAR
jgi:hypothetical protein